MRPHYRPLTHYYYWWTVFMSLLVLGHTEDVPGLPTNVRFQTVNLNSTLLWDSPENTTYDDVIYYTVRYQEESQLSEEWLQTPDCYNITHTVCNFGADFNKISAHWYAQIRAVISSQPGNWTEPEIVQPCCDGIIGRPEFTTVIPYSYTMYLEWVAPETPYNKPDGGYLRMDDVMTVNYNITFWTTNQTENKMQQYLGEDKSVTLRDLTPVTSYEIVLQGETQGKYGIPRHITVSNVIGLPTDLKFRTVNFDSTLTWDRPINVYDEEDVLYTVRYQEQQRLFHGDDWMVKNDCVHTMAQMCNFGADFDIWFGNWHAQIQAWHSPGYRPGSTWTDSIVVCPYDHGIIGPPNMTNITVGSYQVYLSWVAPETPYIDIKTNEPKLVSDMMSVYYNYTYWKTNATRITGYGSTGTTTYLILQNLDPWTSYGIKLQGKTTNQNGIPITLTFDTIVTAPSAGVEIHTVEVKPPVCDKSPDLRDVTIKWTPIDEKDHNGVLTHYEVQVYHDSTVQTQIVTDVSATSTLLTDLYRWEHYAITVSVCNSAGCTGHRGAPDVLDPDKVGLDPPRDIGVDETSPNSFNVSWLPPDNDECIIGYYVTGDNRGSSNYTTFVPDDLYLHVTDVPASSYTIFVSAVIYSDYNSSVLGYNAVTGISIQGTTNAYIAVILVIGFILICLLIACIYYKRDAIKAFIANPLPQKQWQYYMKTTFTMEKYATDEVPEPKEVYDDTIQPTTDTTTTITTAAAAIRTSASSSSDLSESPAISLSSSNENVGIELGIDVCQVAAAGVEEPITIVESSHLSMDSDNYIHRRAEIPDPSLGESSYNIQPYSKLRANSYTSSISYDDDEDEDAGNLSRFMNISLGNIEDAPNIEIEYSLETKSDDGCNSSNTASTYNYSRMTGGDDGSILLGPNKEIHNDQSSHIATTIGDSPGEADEEIIPNITSALVIADEMSTSPLQLPDEFFGQMDKLSIDDSKVEGISDTKYAPETASTAPCEDIFAHLSLSDMIVDFQGDSSSLSGNEQSIADEYGIGQDTVTSDQPSGKQPECFTSCEKPQSNFAIENTEKMLVKDVTELCVDPDKKSTTSGVQCRRSTDDTMGVIVNPLDEFLLQPPESDDDDLLSDDDDDDDMPAIDIAEQPSSSNYMGKSDFNC